MIRTSTSCCAYGVSPLPWGPPKDSSNCHFAPLLGKSASQGSSAQQWRLVTHIVMRATSVCGRLQHWAPAHAG